MPGTLAIPVTKSRDNAGQPKGALRDMLLQLNKAVEDLRTLQMMFCGDHVVVPVVLSTGTTNTLASTTCVVTIKGVPTLIAATTAQALGALGTIAASRWSIIGVDVVAAGTYSFPISTSYAAGFATEALAIADFLATVPRIAGKARIGYIAVQASASTWITGTDGFKLGSGGNVATNTNFYSIASMIAMTGADTNGILIPTVMTRGSTDTRVATTACTFNVLGVPKTRAAVAAGTAFGALGTVPIDKWAAIAIEDDGTTISFVSAPANYTTGYGTEAQAQQALLTVAASVGKARLGYVTFKTKSGTTFVVQTDALLGGASGNVASATNYYPTAGYTPATGLTAAKIGKENGTVITS